MIWKDAERDAQTATIAHRLNESNRSTVPGAVERSSNDRKTDSARLVVPQERNKRKDIGKEKRRYTMADKIKSYCKRPGQVPETVVVTLSIAGIGEYVELHIGQQDINQDSAVLHTKNGFLRGLPYNCEICGVKFYGNILFVGIKGKSFADMSINYAEFKKMCPSLWEV